jgi:hypothetical protein
LINEILDFELNLDMLETDALDESDEIMEDRRHEDAYDYGGIAIEVGGADAEPQVDYDPLNFY